MGSLVANRWRRIGAWCSAMGLDLLYPTICPVCDTFYQEPLRWCSTCASALQALISEPACAHCAKPVASECAPCPWCQGGGIPHFEQVIRLGEYEDPIRKLVLDLKYHRKWGIGELLADELSQLPRVQRLIESVDVIVPVPLHIRAAFKRTYNQAHVVGHRLGRIFSKPVIRAAKRIRHTESQTKMTSMKAREENVKDAFALRIRRGLEGKNILVVDDVTTTGATLKAVGRELKKGGAQSLSALVLAVADPKRRDFESI